MKAENKPVLLLIYLMFTVSYINRTTIAKVIHFFQSQANIILQNDATETQKHQSA